jgi:hypothetical protein
MPQKRNLDEKDSWEEDCLIGFYTLVDIAPINYLQETST